MAKNILLVDDEQMIIEIAKKYLEKEGYGVFQATDAALALQILENQTIDLVITDIMMPEMDGYEFILEVLEKYEKMPFIFISAKSANQDKLYSLTLGADDYLTKPFNPLELVLRVKNILRRVYPEATQKLQFGNLVIDHDRYIASINEQPIELTSKEFTLLWTLAKEPDKVFSKSELLHLVWESEFMDDMNTVNVYIHRLREKLNQFGNEEGMPIIKTVWGIGYKLEVSA
ncbi:response regulator transcription factor [Periweissella fabaria]|uniref:Response regulator SaeR n=1 Tax=Periweissella fabaria TaxID=546157 RepID=A0ABM8Z4H9_9LACO|nr:response regulator transcription factor [Periweissella fabaria]MCM0597267.1 response regulator transcription factor [Periweissella fabaria]CAH0416227.1 Response regulator SaeR [Periweissella fabaria]